MHRTNFKALLEYGLVELFIHVPIVCNVDLLLYEVSNISFKQDALWSLSCVLSEF